MGRSGKADLVFLEPLSRIAERIEGAQALGLFAEDGVQIECIEARVDPAPSLEELGVELMAQARRMRANHREMEAGGVRCYVVQTQERVLVLERSVDEHWLVLVGDPGTPLGRARWELRRAAIELGRELSGLQ